MECKTKEVVAWARKFLDMPELARDAEFAAQMISLISDGYDREGRDHEKRGDAKECGRSFLAAAEALPDPRQARRAAVERGPVLSERAPGRAGGQGVGRADQGAPASTRWRSARSTASAPATSSSRSTSRPSDNYETFAKRYPGEPQARIGAGQRDRVPRGAAAAARGARRHGRVRRLLRRAQSAGRGRRVLPEGGGLRGAEPRRRSARAPARLPRHGGASSGGLDRQVQAHFRLGELAWKASCARASEDGACLHVERMTSTRSRQVIEAANRRLGTEQAHPVRAGDQVQDRRVRPEPAAGVRRRGALPRGDRAVEGGRRGESDRGARRRGAPRGARPTRRRARPSTWPRRTTRICCA